MENSKPCVTPMCPGYKLFVKDSEPFSDPTLYRSTIGALQYLTLTGPDLLFAINKLSQFLQQPTLAHWSACKRVLRYLKGTATADLRFTPTSRFNLEGFSNANWAFNLDDRKSTNGFLVKLGGNLITWASHKQKVVSRSSTES
ncbi:secreted RxLR effector protein 161-like [Humulus lupulus]|uniref:secreted RxLR effector protein 161-like n=1 Tax=Humulus lupulus TaxID=3486 RepID=UPI002B413E46|nr:secreted RxLR effector protein 161-like [Humulus lupulus]